MDEDIISSENVIFDVETSLINPYQNVLNKFILQPFKIAHHAGSLHDFELSYFFFTRILTESSQNLFYNDIEINSLQLHLYIINREFITDTIDFYGQPFGLNENNFWLKPSILESTNKIDKALETFQTLNATTEVDPDIAQELEINISDLIHWASVLNKLSITGSDRFSDSSDETQLDSDEKVKNFQNKQEYKQNVLSHFECLFNPSGKSFSFFRENCLNLYKELTSNEYLNLVTKADGSDSN